MTIGRICVPLCGSSDAKSASLVASDLANRFEAQLIGCFVRRNPEPYVYFAALETSSALQSSLLTNVSAANSGQLPQAKAEFESASLAFGLTLDGEQKPKHASWIGEVASATTFGPFARLNDLIVVAQPCSSKSDGQMDVFDAALFRARRSVLIAPDSATGLTPKSVAIAYNGSAEAARAVTCALPFLREALQVNILTSGRLIEGAPTVENLIEYLAAHGITAKHRPAHEVSATVENTLLSVAHIFDTDLIVMGAYTHSHLREKVLGGVTRSMLEHSDVSVLMAH
jgi:nucleotide-binding universal stress UspA family protein